LLVVDFNPTNTTQLTAFRNRYGISAGVPVLGPFTGLLDNMPPIAWSCIDLTRRNRPRRTLASCLM
jgi:hypothetical protein